VRLQAEIDRGEQVLADPDQLHRIMVNLLRNAREAIEQQQGRWEPGRVSVTLTREANAVVLRFADNGPGLSMRARERLFQAFAGSTRSGGAGLGLAIARELAQGHGGDLTLAETSDKGAVFDLRLPGSPPPLPARRGRGSDAAETSAG